MADRFRTLEGKEVHCVEITSGQFCTGTFMYSTESIRTKLYSFDEFFRLDAKLPIFLRTSKNETVSLYNSFEGSNGSIGKTSNPKKCVYTQEIFSNVAVLGDDEWEPQDLVRRVSFCIDHTMEVLRNERRRKVLSRKGYHGGDDYLLIDAHASNLKIKAYYTAIYEGWDDEPKNVQPRFEVEFDEAVPLGSHINIATKVAWFFSFCLAIPLAPSNINISGQSLREYEEALRQGERRSDHKIVHLRKIFPIGSGDVRIHSSPVVAFSDGELKNLSDCLITWIERSPDWYNSYTQMMGCLSLRNEISAERLITACRWLEEIPDAKATKRISDDVVKKIVRAAQQIAEKEEVGHLSDRISSALSYIKSESHDERFRRLISSAYSGLSLPKDLTTMVGDLKRAITLRGKAAHGHIDITSDGIFKEFSKSVHAVEALCFLLTLRGLPVGDEGRRRVEQSYLLLDYEHS